MFYPSSSRDIVKKGANIKDDSCKQKVFASRSTSCSVGVVAPKRAEKNCRETSPILAAIYFRGAVTTVA